MNSWVFLVIKNDRLPRLLLELPWLIQNRNTSIDNFCAQFDISREDAIKDLSLLTYVGPGRFGGELVDIQYDDENISVIDSQGFDKPLKLNNIEAVLLLLGVKNLIEISDEKQEIKDLEVKLSKIIDADIVASDQEEEYLLKRDIIRDAIKGKKQLIIHYVDSNLKLTSERSISPLNIKSEMAKEYLIALDNYTGQSRSFRLDRIVQIVKVPIEGLVKELVPTNIVGEKILIRTKSWNESNILDLNISYSISAEELLIEMDLLETEFLLDTVLRLDKGIEINCSKEIRMKMKNILQKRIEAIS